MGKVKTTMRELCKAFAYCLVCVAMFHGSSMLAAEHSYDPAANPEDVYEQALARAESEEKLVLLVFGSEWCKDCRSLSKKMRQNPLRVTVEEKFVVAYVDIGNWDLNMAFTEQFGDPVGRGIPSIAIVGPDKAVFYVSQAGEFASARDSDLESLDRWFREKLAEIQ